MGPKVLKKDDLIIFQMISVLSLCEVKKGIIGRNNWKITF